MRNKFFATIAIAACCAVVNHVNAQEVEVIKTNNPADVEFSGSLQAAKYNYGHEIEKKGLHKDVTEAYVGNDSEPTILRSANNEGFELGAFGVAQYFRGNTSFGGGLQLAYLGRSAIGFGVQFSLSNGYPDKTSANQSQFVQLDANVRLYWQALRLANNHFKLCPFIGLGYRKTKFKDESWGGSSYTTVEETEDSWIYTTTTRNDEMRTDPHTINYEAGLRVEWAIQRYSAIHLFAEASCGPAQNFTFDRQWGVRFWGQIGFNVLLKRDREYNHEAIDALGYTVDEVRSFR
jgi:hypothetical protein